MATLEIDVRPEKLAKCLHTAMREWQFTHNGHPDIPPAWDQMKPNQQKFWLDYAALIINELGIKEDIVPVRGARRGALSK